MLRFFLVLLLFSGESVAVARVDGWATQVFLVTKYDFGTVGPGSEASFKFAFRNKFKNAIRLLGVRTSCGCTTPTLVTATGKSVLRTHETGHVFARFNTHAFSGRRSATLTVTLEFADTSGKWHRDEAQLWVTGNIRQDLLIEPRSLHFNNAQQGSLNQRSLVITQTGKPGWQVVEARPEQSWLKARIQERQRTAKQVSYEIQVTLRVDAPLGYFRQRVELTTNEPGSPPESLYVTGQVVPEISVTPARLDFGQVAPGKQVTKKILLRGSQPFRVLGSDCERSCFTAKFGPDSKKIHFVALTFSADSVLGAVEVPFIIHTGSPSCPKVTLRVCGNTVLDD